MEIIKVSFPQSLNKLIVTNYKSFLGGTALLSVILFGWEHVAKKQKTNFKPSVGIEKSAIFFKKLWARVGLYTAKLSSFYTYINLGELYETASDLAKPTKSLVASPLEAFKSYAKAAEEYKYPIMIGAGTLTVTSFVAYLIYAFKNGKLPSFLVSFPIKGLSFRK